MAIREIILTVFNLLGGLAIFVLGMELMTNGLRSFAQNKLRAILSKATENRLNGVGLGTVLGFLVHSSAATVMYVGFVNAGLMTLPQSIAPILGANLGTTLSMQLISFNLTDYAYLAIAVGFGLRMAGVNQKLKHLGTTLLGFGLLFLGMETMSGAIKPHRDMLQPILANVKGDTMGGMLLGVAISAAITGIIQSSGATIGMCFVLIQSGVFVELSGVYPIVLGAHIGTCMTAQLASIGTNINARRTAMAHLYFNLTNVALSIIAAPLFFRVIPWLGGDLVHQTANLNTGVRLVAVLLLLPFTPLFAKAVETLTPSKRVPPQPSFLDRDKLDRPETAIRAAIQELKRAASICEDTLALSKGVFLYGNKEGRVKRIKLNERVINEIKAEMRDYLTDMTHRYMSRRQILLAEHISQCMAHIERIHDHIDASCDLSVRRHGHAKAHFDHESMEKIFRLFNDARHVLELLTMSFDPDKGKNEEASARLMDVQEAFSKHEDEVSQYYAERVAEHDFPPIVGIFFGEYVALIQRLIGHAAAIASVERDVDFFVKAEKLDRVAEELDEDTHEMPPEEAPDDVTDTHNIETDPAGRRYTGDEPKDD